MMTLAWEQVKGRIKVSEFYLTGYSLGASQSAFVAKIVGWIIRSMTARCSISFECGSVSRGCNFDQLNNS